jgi:serine/threonine-protein kinase PknG
VEIPPVPYRDPASAILANPQILRAALDWCATGQPAGNGPILGCEPNARALRFGLERSYRVLARLTPDEERRIELVDMANAIRPRTLT